MNGEIRAVMFFCAEPKEVALWWAQLLDAKSDHVNEEESGFFWFNAGGTEYGFHPADAERNPLGGTPVVYLATSSFEATLQRAIAKGALAHRGPLEVSSERSIAQLVDPFGNIFGVDGS
jgi:predicted enzyme related to lactoylglutathione lyase